MKEKDKQTKYKTKNRISNFNYRNYNFNEKIDNLEKEIVNIKHKIDKYEFAFKCICYVTIFIVTLLSYIAVDFKNDIFKEFENIKQKNFLIKK